MEFDVNQIASQLAQNFALQQAKVREKENELAKLEAAITHAHYEVEQARSHCKECVADSKREQGEFEQLAARAKAELTMTKAAIDAQRDARAREEQEHRAKVNRLKAEYASLEKNERDSIAKLASTRDLIKSEIRDVLAKLKELA